MCSRGCLNLQWEEPGNVFFQNSGQRPPPTPHTISSSVRGPDATNKQHRCIMSQTLMWLQKNVVRLRRETTRWDLNPRMNRCIRCMYINMFAYPCFIHVFVYILLLLTGQHDRSWFHAEALIWISSWYSTMTSINRTIRVSSINTRRYGLFTVLELCVLSEMIFSLWPRVRSFPTPWIHNATVLHDQ